jgi:outer membrane protein OmpA-like peptidoglycan-associated protein
MEFKLTIQRYTRARLFGAAWLALALAACASRGYVDDRLREREQAAMAQVTALQEGAEASRLDLERLAADDRRLAESAASAATEVAAASAQAESSAALANGTFFGTILLVDDSVRFARGSVELTAEGASLLDVLAAQLLLRDEDAVLELHGHTDSTGDEARNRRLGLARADAVRRYLEARHRIPLARMEMISSGSSMPIADNASPEGRACNRRVTVVVRSR